MAYTFKGNSYFQTKKEKEEEERQKRAAAQRRATNQDARTTAKPVYGPPAPNNTTQSSQKPAYSSPLLNNIQSSQKPVYGPPVPTKNNVQTPTIKFNNTPRKTTTLLDMLMEQTGIDPRKRETRQTIIEPYKKSTTTEVKRSVMPQVASSPLLRNMLRQKGVKDPVLDIYEYRDKQKAEKQKTKPLINYDHSPISRAIETGSANGLRILNNKLREIDNSALTFDEKQKLRKMAFGDYDTSLINDAMVRAVDERDAIIKKYGGDMASPADIKSIINDLDEWYLITRDAITGGGGVENYRKEMQEIDPEWVKEYDNYHKERAAWVEKLRDMERLVDLNTELDTYSGYNSAHRLRQEEAQRKEEANKTYNTNLGKQFKGFDNDGNAVFDKGYNDIKTGNKLIDNFLIKKSGNKIKDAEVEIKNAVYINKYYERELKPFLKVLNDMNSDAAFAESISRKYYSDEEYKTWWDRKARLYQEYKEKFPGIEANAKRAEEEINAYSKSEEENLKELERPAAYIKKYQKEYGKELSIFYNELDEKFEANYELGQFGAGNIDLYNRPVLQNDDGSISTVDSITIFDNGKYVLIPTIIFDVNDERKLSDEEAIAYYKESGEYLGQFATEREAQEYAQKLHDAQDFYYGSRYNTTKNGKEKSYITRMDATTGGIPMLRTFLNETGYDDLAYEMVNRNDEAFGLYDEKNLQEHGVITGNWMPDKTFLKEMSEDEIAIYNYIYSQVSPEEANKFLKNISKDLNLIRSKKKQQQWQQYATESTVLANVESVARNLLKPFDFAAMLGASATGGIDGNAYYADNSRFSSTVREVTGSTMSPVGRELYNLGMSIADMGTSYAVSGGQSWIYALLNGTSSAADTIVSAKDRGLTDAQAMGLGTVAGLVSFAFSKRGFDDVFSKGATKSGIINNIKKSFINEGIEGVTEEAINFTADIIISQEKSEWNAKIEKFKEQGYNDRDAIGMAVADTAKDLAITGAREGAAGGVMGGITSSVKTYTTGKAAISDSAEFKTYTDNIINADISDYTGDAAKLQDAVKTYVEKSENAKTSFGTILNAGKAMSAASEFQGTPKVITTEEISKEDRDFLNKFSKGTGVNILYTTIPQDMESGYKGGFFVEGTNTLVVDRGTSAIDMLKQTVAHEMSHATEGTRWFDAYKRSAIRDIEGIEGKSFNTLVQEKRDFYRANGIEPKDAEAEVIADYTAKLFDDHNLIDKLVKRDYNTASLLLDGMKDIYNKLKTKFTGKEIGGVEETVRYLERALGMRNQALTSGGNVQYNITNKIKYSPKGLNLPKNEYAKFKQSVNTDYYMKYKTHKGLQYQSCVTDNSHILYVYEDGGFDKYKVVARIDYADDQVAKMITEELRNDESNNITEVVNNVLETIKIGRSGYSVYNAYTKKRSISRGNGIISSGKQKPIAGGIDAGGTGITGDKRNTLNDVSAEVETKHFNKDEYEEAVEYQQSFINPKYSIQKLTEEQREAIKSREGLTEKGDVRYNITDDNDGKGKVSIDEGSNSEGMERYGTYRSGDGVREQSNDTEGIHRGLGSTTPEMGIHESKRQRTGTDRFVRNMQQSLQRYGESISRDLSEIKIQNIDVDGRRLTNKVTEYFKDTVTKTQEGYLVPFFHGTLSEFDVFEQGDIGFHFGTFEQAEKRINQKITEDKEGTKKVIEAYINITTPIYLPIDKMQWDAFTTAYQLYDNKVITETQLKDVISKQGAILGKYNSEAAKTLRKILSEKGYDGIVYNNGFEGEGVSFIVFESNQIKYVTNESPTSDASMKYSLQNLTPEQQKAIEADRQKAIDYAMKKMETSIKDVGEKDKDDTPLSRKLDRIAMHWVDRFRFLERFDEAAEKNINAKAEGDEKTAKKKVATKDKAYIMAMNSLNSDGSVMYIIKNGMTNLNGDVNIGKGLFEILDVIKSKDERAAFEKYLVAKHAIEWLSDKKGGVPKEVYGDEKQDREDVQAGIVERLEKNIRILG